jgi:hypothetical protein
LDEGVTRYAVDAVDAVLVGTVVDLRDAGRKDKVGEKCDIGGMAG